jgi:hypothetical protein
MSRKDQYDREGVGVNWKLRGVGFLYEKRNLVLAARVVNASCVFMFNALTRGRAAQAASGTKIGGGGMRGIGRPRDDCDELTVWVRVYGPEIFAGSARAVPATEASDCSWSFNFRVGAIWEGSSSPCVVPLHRSRCFPLTFFVASKANSSRHVLCGRQSAALGQQEQGLRDGTRLCAAQREVRAFSRRRTGLALPTPRWLQGLQVLFPNSVVLRGS